MNSNQLNDNIVKVIVDKLGYSKEEVRYHVLNALAPDAKKKDDSNSNFVASLYRRLVAEEQEKEQQSFSGGKKFANTQTFSNNAVSQTSLGLSGHGPPDGGNGQ